MTQEKPGMRLQLWLRKSDGRHDDPEYFIKDVAALDDPYQKDRFNGRTFSDADKFVTGTFLTDSELDSFRMELIEARKAMRNLEAIRKEAWEAARVAIGCDIQEDNECHLVPGMRFKYATFEDYQNQKKEGGGNVR